MNLSRVSRGYGHLAVDVAGIIIIILYSIFITIMTMLIIIIIIIINSGPDVPAASLPLPAEVVLRAHARGGRVWPRR